MDKIFLSPELIRAIIENDNATYADLDALWFMVANVYGLQSPLLDDISAAIERIQFPIVEITEPVSVDAVDMGAAIVWLRAEAV